MYAAIVERVKTRLRQFHIEEIDGVSTKVYDKLEDNPVIEECVKSNIGWLKKKLNKDFSAVELSAFEVQHEDILVDLTLYDMCLEGAEFQISHNENGVNRSYRSKDEIFSSHGYFSFIKFLF